MRTRRRGFGARAVLAVVVVGGIGALLLGTDRVALMVVEGRVSSRLQTELGTQAKPRVDIDGFPFLMRALTGSTPSVSVVADGVGAADQRGRRVAHLELTLHDVQSQDRFTTFTAGRVDGTATMDYAEVQKLIATPLSYAGDGRVEAEVETTIVSLPVTARIRGRPVVEVEDQTLTLAEPEIAVAGVDVPEATSQALLDTLLKPIPITGVPFNLSVTAVTAADRGLDAALLGENVALTR